MDMDNLSKVNQIIIIKDDVSINLFLLGTKLCEMPLNVGLVHAAKVMLSFYYLLDFDYPKYYELSFSIFQYYFFGDTSVPLEITKDLDAYMNKFSDFKIKRLKSTA